jgi:hemolysin activation/secretion protein
VLVVKAARRAGAGRLTVDNWGSREIGPIIATLGYDFNGLITAGDEVSISGSTTPQVKEFAAFSASYTTKLNSRGTEASIGASWYRVRPEAALAQNRLVGDSLEADASISHPLVRSRAASLGASAEGMLLDSNLNQAGLPVRRDRIRTLSATLAGNAAAAGGRIRGRVALVEGLPVLDATPQGDPLASRRDGSAVFTKLEFSADYRRTLAAHLSIVVAATGQLATRPLLATMEMGLGGRRFLRAYDYRELSGDNGVAGSAELRYEIPRLGPLVSGMQIYAYGDAGTVSNLRQGGGGGSLASAGGGLRLRLAKATGLGLELAVPLSTTASDPSPKPRFSTSISQGF